MVVHVGTEFTARNVFAHSALIAFLADHAPLAAGARESAVIGWKRTAYCNPRACCFELLRFLLLLLGVCCLLKLVLVQPLVFLQNINAVITPLRSAEWALQWFTG